MSTGASAKSNQFDRAEVEDAFVHWWTVGNAGEDWYGWVDLFTPDVYYVDHFWGPLRGRDEVRLWIEAVMKGVPEIYTYLDWYRIDDDAVTFHCQNRRDNPDPTQGPAYFDFPGLSMVWYAGNGLWRAEEDFWDRTGARTTSVEYAEACRRAGADDPRSRMTRRHWPEEPAWARGVEHPSPSWLERDDIPGITRPSELRTLLASLRG